MIVRCIEGPVHGSVEQGDPREWSAEEVATCLRAWRTTAWYQSAADQVLQHGSMAVLSLVERTFTQYIIEFYGTGDQVTERRDREQTGGEILCGCASINKIFTRGRGWKHTSAKRKRMHNGFVPCR
jgi:hypothetical protein